MQSGKVTTSLQIYKRGTGGTTGTRIFYHTNLLLRRIKPKMVVVDVGFMEPHRFAAHGTFQIAPHHIDVQHHTRALFQTTYLLFFHKFQNKSIYKF